MKFRNLLWIASLLAVIAHGPTASAKDEPIVLKPSSPWQLDSSPERCALIRTFGTGDDKVEINLGKRVPTDSPSLLMVGNYARVKRIGPALGDPGPSNRVKFQFLDDGPAGYYRAVTAARDGEPALFSEYLVQLPPEDRDPDLTPEQLQEQYGISAANLAGTRGLLMEGLKHDLLLATDSFGKAFAALDQCEDALLTYRGLDPEKERGRQKGPELADELGQHLADLVQANYPSTALRDGRSGYVTMILKVDADGAVTDCSAYSVFDNPDLDQSACNIFKANAHYSPALDANGKPFASYAVQSVKYLITG